MTLLSDHVAQHGDKITPQAGEAWLHRMKLAGASAADRLLFGNLLKMYRSRNMTAAEVASQDALIAADEA